jgi:hypothetical protein
MFSHLFYPEKVEGFDILLQYYYVKPRFSFMDLLMQGIAYTAWPFLLAVGYFKLKELEL